MPSDEMVEKARKIADDMFFGPHKPECDIPEDQTMTVRYGHAVRVISAALAAAEAGEQPVAWRWRYDGDPTWTLAKREPKSWPDTIIEPLYASPSEAAIRADERAAFTVDDLDPLYGMVEALRDTCSVEKRFEIAAKLAAFHKEIAGKIEATAIRARGET